MLKAIYALVFCFCLAQAKQMKLNPFGDGRIVNGDIAEPHSIPYQVGIHITRENATRRSFCGGTLISENYVMTAAHCADGAIHIEVVLGAHEILEEESTQVHINSTEFTVHSNWDWNNLHNDIALLKLSSPAPLNENIQLVNLPSLSEVDETFEDQPARASGWGKIADSETTISPILRKVDLTVIGNTRCNTIYLGQIADSQICSSGANNKGPCNGDSGGPLAVDNGNKQVGIASFVTDFGCEAGFPAGWTRVSKFLGWLAEHSDVVINP